MDKKMNELPLWYKLTSAASIGFLAGCTVSGGVSPTIDSNPGSNNNPNNVDAIPTKTDFERAKETLNSFVTSHPEYSNREASVVNFSINNIDSNTVILETTEEEKQEISSFKYEFDGYPLQQYDKAIVFTMKTNPDGKSQWVRLAGVWFPTEDGSVNTAWYYSPDAFDKNKEVIDFKQRVFGFNSRDDEYVFWPLVEPPYQMLWSLDISSKDSKDYTPWNGIDPFTLPVGAIPVGAGKALFAPMQVDIKPESLLPQEVERPIKEFLWCKDMHKFEECVIDVVDLQEHGRFAQSTLTEDLFDPALLKIMTEYSTPRDQDGEFLIPNIATAPNYKNEKTAPFKKSYMSGVTTINGVDQYVIQVPYYIEGIVAKKFPVITGLAEAGDGGYRDWGVTMFLNKMNVVPWNISDLSLATQYKNPNTGVNFTIEEVNVIVEEMKVGNFANTNGLVLKFDIADNHSGWYR